MKKTKRITRHNQAGITHTYATPGEYEVVITGTCEGFEFDFDFYLSKIVGDCAKLLDVSQWDSVKLHNGGFQFAYCISLSGFSAADTPDLSSVTNMHDMFLGASAFNQDIGSWDVSKVTNMSDMFYEAESFNQDISGWTVAQVTDYGSMFTGCPIDPDSKPKF